MRSRATATSSYVIQLTAAQCKLKRGDLLNKLILPLSGKARRKPKAPKMSRQAASAVAAQTLMALTPGIDPTRVRVVRPGDPWPE